MSQEIKRQESPASSAAIGKKDAVNEESHLEGLRNEPHLVLSPEEEKKLLRKLDLRLIPMLSLLYLLSFLDRTAIGNARLYGLQNDVNLTDQQYLLALTIFFIPYALAEPVSNVLLKRLTPRIWFSAIMVAWGACMLAGGFVHNFSGIMAQRFFLGLTEAGLFPGVNYYLSCWYRRREFGIRAAIFFSAATVSGAFGGLLAAAIHNMDGVGGLASWSWIFILYGLATIVIGIISYWVIVDFPDSSRSFLTPEERAHVVARLQLDGQFSAGGEKLEMRHVLAGMKDWRQYCFMLMYAGIDGPLYAFSLFTPSIINQLGYSATRANLISVPIYVWACICTVAVGFLADRQGRRCLFNFIFLGFGLAGYIILIASRNAALSYFAIYLSAMGIYVLIPNVIALASNAFEGTYKRSWALGMVIGFGNLNGACTSNVYKARDRPWYTLGHGIVLMYLAIGLIATVVYYIFSKRENEARDRGERDEVIGGTPDPAAKNGWFATVEDAKREKGDRWSGFRYIL